MPSQCILLDSTAVPSKRFHDIAPHDDPMQQPSSVSDRAPAGSSIRERPIPTIPVAGEHPGGIGRSQGMISPQPHPALYLGAPAPFHTVASPPDELPPTALPLVSVTASTLASARLRLGQPAKRVFPASDARFGDPVRRGDVGAACSDCTHPPATAPPQPAGTRPAVPLPSLVSHSSISRSNTARKTFTGAFVASSPPRLADDDATGLAGTGTSEFPVGRGGSLQPYPGATAPHGGWNKGRIDEASGKVSCVLDNLGPPPRSDMVPLVLHQSPPPRPPPPPSLLISLLSPPSPDLLPLHPSQSPPPPCLPASAPSPATRPAAPALALPPLPPPNPPTAAPPTHQITPPSEQQRQQQLASLPRDALGGGADRPPNSGDRAAIGNSNSCNGAGANESGDCGRTCCVVAGSPPPTSPSPSVTTPLGYSSSSSAAFLSSLSAAPSPASAPQSPRGPPAVLSAAELPLAERERTCPSAPYFELPQRRASTCDKDDRVVGEAGRGPPAQTCTPSSPIWASPLASDLAASGDGGAASPELAPASPPSLMRLQAPDHPAPAAMAIGLWAPGISTSAEETPSMSAIPPTGGPVEGNTALPSTSPIDRPAMTASRVNSATETSSTPAPQRLTPSLPASSSVSAPPPSAVCVLPPLASTLAAPPTQPVPPLPLPPMSMPPQPAPAATLGGGSPRRALGGVRVVGPPRRTMSTGVMLAAGPTILPAPTLPFEPRSPGRAREQADGRSTLASSVRPTSPRGSCCTVPGGALHFAAATAASTTGAAPATSVSSATTTITGSSTSTIISTNTAITTSARAAPTLVPLFRMRRVRSASCGGANEGITRHKRARAVGGLLSPPDARTSPLALWEACTRANPAPHRGSPAKSCANSKQMNAVPADSRCTPFGGCPSSGGTTAAAILSRSCAGRGANKRKCSRVLPSKHSSLRSNDGTPSRHLPARRIMRMRRRTEHDEVAGVTARADASPTLRTSAASPTRHKGTAFGSRCNCALASVLQHSRARMPPPLRRTRSLPACLPPTAANKADGTLIAHSAPVYIPVEDTPTPADPFPEAPVRHRPQLHTQPPLPRACSPPRGPALPSVETPPPTVVPPPARSTLMSPGSPPLELAPPTRIAAARDHTETPVEQITCVSKNAVEQNLLQGELRHYLSAAVGTRLGEAVGVQSLETVTEGCAQASAGSKAEATATRKPSAEATSGSTALPGCEAASSELGIGPTASVVRQAAVPADGEARVDEAGHLLHLRATPPDVTPPCTGPVGAPNENGRQVGLASTGGAGGGSEEGGRASSGDSGSLQRNSGDCRGVACSPSLPPPPPRPHLPDVVPPPFPCTLVWPAIPSPGVTPAAAPSVHTSASAPDSALSSGGAMLLSPCAQPVPTPPRARSPTHASTDVDLSSAATATVGPSSAPAARSPASPLLPVALRRGDLARGALARLPAVAAGPRGCWVFVPQPLCAALGVHTGTLHAPRAARHLSSITQTLPPPHLPPLPHSPSHPGDAQNAGGHSAVLAHQTRREAPATTLTLDAAASPAPLPPLSTLPFAPVALSCSPDCPTALPPPTPRPASPLLSASSLVPSSPSLSASSTSACSFMRTVMLLAPSRRGAAPVDTSRVACSEPARIPVPTGASSSDVACAAHGRTAHGDGQQGAAPPGCTDTAKVGPDSAASADPDDPLFAVQSQPPPPPLSPLSGRAARSSGNTRARECHSAPRRSLSAGRARSPSYHAYSGRVLDGLSEPPVACPLFDNNSHGAASGPISTADLSRARQAPPTSPHLAIAAPSRTPEPAPAAVSAVSPEVVLVRLHSAGAAIAASRTPPSSVKSLSNTSPEYGVTCVSAALNRRVPPAAVPIGQANRNSHEAPSLPSSPHFSVCHSPQRVTSAPPSPDSLACPPAPHSPAGPAQSLLRQTTAPSMPPAPPVTPPPLSSGRPMETSTGLAARGGSGAKEGRAVVGPCPADGGMGMAVHYMEQASTEPLAPVAPDEMPMAPYVASPTTPSPSLLFPKAATLSPGRSQRSESPAIDASPSDAAGPPAFQVALPAQWRSPRCLPRSSPAADASSPPRPTPQSPPPSPQPRARSDVVAASFGTASSRNGASATIDLEQRADSAVNRGTSASGTECDKAWLFDTQGPAIDGSAELLVDSPKDALPPPLLPPPPPESTKLEPASAPDAMLASVGTDGLQPASPPRAALAPLPPPPHALPPPPPLLQPSSSLSRYCCTSPASASLTVGPEAPTSARSHNAMATADTSAANVNSANAVETSFGRGESGGGGGTTRPEGLARVASWLVSWFGRSRHASASPPNHAHEREL